MSAKSLVRTTACVLLAGAAAGSLFSLPGCEAASAGGEAVGSAYDAIESAFRAGKTERFSNVSVETAVAATKAAGEDLGLTFVRVSIHPDQQKIVFKDDRRQEVVCTLVRRSGRMTEILVDVGLLGPSGFAKLTLDRIRIRLGEVSEVATRPSLSSEQ